MKPATRAWSGLGRCAAPVRAEKRGIVARYGGEEFEDMMIGFQRPAENMPRKSARQRAKEILIGRSLRAQWNNQLGLRSAAGRGSRQNDADRRQAIYTAKRPGRDRVVAGERRSLEIA